jgi:hypothetical protein
MARAYPERSRSGSLSAMTELDLINLGRSITSNEVSWFGQLITINFAMVIAIYYFLHQAKLLMKLFAFLAYTVGTLFYFTQILLESNLKLMTVQTLAALPHPSNIAQEYVGLTQSWLGDVAKAVFTGSFWLLWLAMIYLLFFWRRGEEV